jgi:orotate phosphoribosyltransferase
MRVRQAITVVDRQEGAAELLHDNHGLELQTLITRRDLEEWAKALGT